MHALRHGADIGEAMKVGALNWRDTGRPADFGSPQKALEWAEKYLHMPDGMCGGGEAAAAAAAAAAAVAQWRPLAAAHEAALG